MSIIVAIDNSLRPRITHLKVDWVPEDYLCIYSDHTKYKQHTALPSRVSLPTLLSRDGAEEILVGGLTLKDISSKRSAVYRRLSKLARESGYRVHIKNLSVASDTKYQVFLFRLDNQRNLLAYAPQ